MEKSSNRINNNYLKKMYISTQIGRCIVEEPDLKNRMLYKTLELELQSTNI